MREPWRTSVLVRFDATRHRSCFRVRHSIGLKETYSQVCAAFIARSLKRTNTGNQYGSRHKSRKRLFLQGLSQVAAAFYHLQRNCAGTISAREPFPCCDLPALSGRVSRGLCGRCGYATSRGHPFLARSPRRRSAVFAAARTAASTDDLRVGFLLSSSTCEVNSPCRPLQAVITGRELR